MTRFAEEIEDNMTVEWRDKYLQYNILAQLLKALRSTTDSAQTKLIAKRSFSLLSLTYPLQVGKYDTNAKNSIQIQADFGTGGQGGLDNNITSDTTPHSNPTLNSLVIASHFGEDKDGINIIGDSVATTGDDYTITPGPDGTNTITTTHPDHPNHPTTTNNHPLSIKSGSTAGPFSQRGLQMQQFLAGNEGSIRTRNLDPKEQKLIEQIALQQQQTARQQIMNSIDEYNIATTEQEHQEMMAQLSPGLQVIQQQQQEVVRVAHLNSITQIHAFSKELRGKRQQLLLQQIEQLNHNLSNNQQQQHGGSVLDSPLVQRGVQLNDSEGNLTLLPYTNTNNPTLSPNTSFLRNNELDHSNHSNPKMTPLRSQGSHGTMKSQKSYNGRGSISVAKQPQFQSGQRNGEEINLIDFDKNKTIDNTMNKGVIELLSDSYDPFDEENGNSEDDTNHHNTNNNDAYHDEEGADVIIIDHQSDDDNDDSNSPDSTDQDIIIPYQHHQGQQQPTATKRIILSKTPSKYPPQLKQHSSSFRRPASGHGGTDAISNEYKTTLVRTPSSTLTNRSTHSQHSQHSNSNAHSVDRFSAGSINSHRVEMARYTNTVAEIAVTRKRLTKAEFLNKKYANSSMTSQLRQTLQHSPFGLGNIDNFYRNRYVTSNGVNQKGLELNGTSDTTQILTATFKIRQALTSQSIPTHNDDVETFEYHQHTSHLVNPQVEFPSHSKKNKNYRKKRFTDGSGEEWSSDDGSDYDDALSKHNPLLPQNSNNVVTPGYSPHRVTQINLPPLNPPNKRKKNWSEYFKLNNAPKALAPSQSFFLSRSSPGQIDQEYYNKLLDRLDRYGNTVPALCRPKKYYESLRTLCTYLHKTNRLDLLPTMPLLKNPVEILNELYPIQLRDQGDIESEFSQLPIFHTFLPANCDRYQVEVLFCNALQAQVEKIHEFTLLLEVYYDANLWNIASVLSQLQYSEILLQQCLVDPNYSTSINIVEFIKMKDKQILSIKRTLAEIYRGLIYLDNFQNINLVGFAKILKKHDKVSTSFPFSRNVLLPLIFSTHFAQSTAGIHMKHYMESLFAQVYVDSRHEFKILQSSIANINSNNKLTSSSNIVSHSSTTHSEKKSSSLTTFAKGLFGGGEKHEPITITNWIRLGIHAGIMVTLLISNILLYLFYPKAAFESQNFQVGFPTFRILTYIILACWTWSFVAYFCERARLNYQLILQLNPRTFLRPPQLFEMSSFLSVLAMLCFTAYVFTLAIDSEDIIHFYIVYGTLLLFIGMLLNPLNVMHRPTRWYILKNTLFFFCAPFTPATLQVSLWGNMMSSTNRLLPDFAQVACYYTKYPITKLPPPVDASSVCRTFVSKKLWFLTSIPSFFRGMQGVRAAHYSGEWYPYIASSMKYFIAVPGAVAQWYMRSHDFILWSVIVWAIILGTRGLWSTVWDWTMDWKLFARYQAVSDRYENLIVHLHQQDKNLIMSDINLSSQQHQNHYFKRFANKSSTKLKEEYAKLVLISKSSVANPLVLHGNASTNPNNTDPSNPNGYFNQNAFKPVSGTSGIDNFAVFDNQSNNTNNNNNNNNNNNMSTYGYGADRPPIPMFDTSISFTRPGGGDDDFMQQGETDDINHNTYYSKPDDVNNNNNTYYSKDESTPQQNQTNNHNRFDSTDTRQQLMVSTIDEHDQTNIAGQGDYYQLDANTTAIVTRVKRIGCCEEFFYYMTIHNNIIHFKPKLSSRYARCCCKTKPSRMVSVSTPHGTTIKPSHLPQSYSAISLAIWYFFYLLIARPFKFILSVLWYPTFYFFVGMGFILTCLPCRSIYRHTRYRLKSAFPNTLGRPKPHHAASVSRRWWRHHQPTPYLYQTMPNFPTFFLPLELQQLYFHHSMKFYWVSMVIGVLWRNIWVLNASPKIPTFLGISSEWMTFFIGMFQIIGRGLWTYLRFESEQLKLTNKLQAVNLEGEIRGQEHGQWRRKVDDDDNDDDHTPISSTPDPNATSLQSTTSPTSAKPTSLLNPSALVAMTSAGAANNAAAGRGEKILQNKSNNNNDCDEDGTTLNSLFSHDNTAASTMANYSQLIDASIQTTTPISNPLPINPLQGTSSTYLPSLDAAMEITKLLLVPSSVMHTTSSATTGSNNTTNLSSQSVSSSINSYQFTTQLRAPIDDFLATDDIIVDPIQQARADLQHQQQYQQQQQIQLGRNAVRTQQITFGGRRMTVIEPINEESGEDDSGSGEGGDDYHNYSESSFNEYISNTGGPSVMELTLVDIESGWEKKNNNNNHKPSDHNNKKSNKANAKDLATLLLPPIKSSQQQHKPTTTSSSSSNGQYLEFDNDRDDDDYQQDTSHHYF